MGVRRRLLRELLSSLKYIKNLTEHQIHASLWRGEGTLRDLELEPRRLQQLYFDSCPGGVEILEVTIKEVRVRIPWRHIMTQSIVLNVRDVEVKVAVHCEDDVEWKEVFSQCQRKFLAAQQDRQERAPFKFSSGATGSFDQLGARIMDGLKIHVSSAKLSIMSSHQRHFPCHGPHVEDTRPLEEVLRVCGEDILISPCGAGGVPCDNLKQMTTYVPTDRVLQITKFMKCQSFRVSPGRCSCSCPHAVTEFMETAPVLTCHLTNRYPSDGLRMCPFIVGFDQFFELQSLLEVHGCECQLRAFTAVIADISRLEEWRQRPEIIGCTVQGSSCNAGSTSVRQNSVVPGVAAAEEPPLADTSSLARTFARGADWKRHQAAAASDAAHNRALAQAEATTLVGEVSADEPNTDGGTFDAAPQMPQQRTLVTGDAAPSVPPAPVAVTPREGVSSQGSSASPFAQSSHTQAPTATLVNTSSMARSIAQGQSRTSNTKSISSQVWRKLWKGSSKVAAPSQQPLSPGLSSSPAMSRVGLDETEHGHDTFLDAAEDVEEERKEDDKDEQQEEGDRKDAAEEEGEVEACPSEQGHSSEVGSAWGVQISEGSCQASLPETLGNLAPAQAAGVCETAEDTESGRETPADSGPLGVRSPQPSSSAAEAEDDDEDDEVVGICDAEDYFSVASDDVAADMLPILGPMRHSQWLSPVLKFFGGKTNSTEGIVGGPVVDWPEMRCVTKNIGLAVPSLLARITIVDEQLRATGIAAMGLTGSAGGDGGIDGVASPMPSNVGAIHLSVDGLAWRSDMSFALPATQLDCLARLSHGVDAAQERGHLQASASKASEIGPHNLHVLLAHAQRMDWPRVKVLVGIGSRDGGVSSDVPAKEVASDVAMEVMLASLDAVDGEAFSPAPFGTEPMVRIEWKPRESPATLLVEPSRRDGTQLQTWPMQIRLRRARLVGEPERCLFLRRYQERSKPFLSAKNPLPMTLPSLDSSGDEVFPVEALSIELDDCELWEPFPDKVYLQEQRWPLRVRVPHSVTRSHSDQWDLSQVLAEGGVDANASARESAIAGDSTAESDEASSNVSIPKEMFDQLVRRAAEATLKDAQVVAAREELQKAYIALAVLKAQNGSHSSASSSTIPSSGGGSGAGSDNTSLTTHRSSNSSTLSWSAAHGTLKSSGKALSSAIGGAWSGFVDYGGSYLGNSASGGGSSVSAAAASANTAAKGSTSVAVGAAAVTVDVASCGAGCGSGGSSNSDDRSGKGGTAVATTDHDTLIDANTAPVAASNATATSAVVDDTRELERLRRRCLQLESSMASQGLSHRRLETELAHYQALARNELRQVLSAKTHAS